MQQKLQILFEDPHLIVLDKPSGLLSQGEVTGADNLVDLLRQYLGRPYVGLVHRLDRNASGVMVVAKRTKSARRLTQSLQSGKLTRTYWAWVGGEPPGQFDWQATLLKDPKTNVSRVVSPDTGGAKHAQLKGQTLKTGTLNGKRLSLVQINLETGRSHQIRAQFAHEGHPLLGDTKYGGEEFSRLALHSRYLSFPHPKTQEKISFEAKFPEDLQKILIE